MSGRTDRRTRVDHARVLTPDELREFEAYRTAARVLDLERKRVTRKLAALRQRAWSRWRKLEGVSC
jgi:predicted amidohydrolase YtcJ